MVNSIARITLDIQDLSTSVTVSAKHGDTGRKIVIALSDGGFLYEIGPDCYAALTAEKPDGSILFNHCDIEGNCIVYAFTEQTTAVVGVFPCEVKLYGADDALITTARFRIIVDGTVYNDGRVESKDEISALTHLISQVSEAKENAEQAAEDGAAAVQSSLLALENADEAIRTANTAANNANLAAEEANKYLPVATEALQTAGAAVQTANEAKQGVNTLREVVSKFHSNIVETATGEVIQLSDASDLELAGLRIFGKTEQKSTTGKNLLEQSSSNWQSEEKTNGIKYTYVRDSDGNLLYINADGTTAEGTNSHNKKAFTTLPPGTYIVSGCPSGYGSDISIRIGKGPSGDYIGIDQGNGYTFTLTEETIISINLTVGSGKAVSNVKFYPMIRLASVTDATYEPYTGGKPSPSPDYPQELESVGESVNVTIEGAGMQPQAFTVATPYGLPGILVTSGGNHTDVDGKEWICDEIDFEKGVYVQRVKILSNWSTIAWLTGNVFYTRLTGENVKLYSTILCSHYKEHYVSYSLMDDGSTKLGDALYIVDSRYTASTLGDFKTWLTDNGVTALVPLAEHKEIPLSEIAPDALAQYATLHTNYPNTTVYNDARAHMEVSYIADTQKYVDKKFEALEAAIANLI